MNKKIANLLFASTLSLGTMFGLTGCGSTVPPSSGTLSSKADIYGFSAFSATALLPELSSGKEVMENLSSQVILNEGELFATINPIVNEIDIVNKYLNMFDDLLSNNDLLDTSILISDKPEYKNKLLIQTTDIWGKLSSKTLYYNEKALYTQEEVDADDESEIETAIDGILISDGNEYKIAGVREVEDDEIETTFIAKIDEENYVKIKQEVEEGEQSFVYEVFKNGVKIQSSKIEIEKEDGEINIKLSFTSGASKGLYSFSKEVEGQESSVKITFSTNGISGSIKVLISENEITGEKVYKYKFSNGFEMDKEFND